MNHIHNIKRLFKVIDNSLFMTTGNLDYERITDAIISLSNEVHNIPDDDSEDAESIWYIGEYGNCCLPDLITGAYWHYSEWHGGQWSQGYAALSALGEVFQPGMTTPESDNLAYTMLNDIAHKFQYHTRSNTQL